MLILACNVGSTSLKYRLYHLGEEETELAHGHFEGIGRPVGRGRQQAGDIVTNESEPRPGYAEAIGAMLAFLRDASVLPGGQPDCVAFKTVAALHTSGVVELTEAVLLDMEAMNTLLPAHNPPYVSAVRQFHKLMPDVKLIGSFETGFFRNMPEEAYLYPLPIALSAQGIRKNGAHGASHEYITRWVEKREGRGDLRLISCHLGGSSSIAAVKNGKGVDTTLGLSLQSGLAHNNRVGDVDPYLSFYLMESLGYTPQEVKTLYEKESGLLGLSGVSGDMRLIEEAAENGHSRARAALDVFCYGVKKTIGAFAAALGGLDVIAFTGGIGQNSARVRLESLAGLSFLGIRMDEQKNREAKPDCLISAEDSLVRVYLIATNEEIVIARKARAFLEDSGER